MQGGPQTVGYTVLGCSLEALSRGQTIFALQSGSGASTGYCSVSTGTDNWQRLGMSGQQNTTCTATGLPNVNHVYQIGNAPLPSAPGTLYGHSSLPLIFRKERLSVQ